MIIAFLGMIAKLSDICFFSCLAQFSSSFSHSPLKIILKQLFASGSVNIAEYLPRLRLGKYSAIFTSPSAINLLIDILPFTQHGLFFSAEKYCKLVRDEGGISLLQGLAESARTSPRVRELAQMTLDKCRKQPENAASLGGATDSCFI